MSSARHALAALLACLTAALCLAPAAQGEFGFSEFEVAFTDAEGNPVTQAGSHPFAMSVTQRFISEETGKGGEKTDEAAKDVLVTLPEGFVGNPTAVLRCETADFLTAVDVGPGQFKVPGCPDAAALGTVSVELSGEIGKAEGFGAVYNLQTPPGAAARLGFWVASVPVTMEFGVAETRPYNVTGGPTNISQVLEVLGAEFTLWGNPADPAHDPVRGHCIDTVNGESLDKCEAGGSDVPFLTLPRECSGEPLRTRYRIDSWQNPGVFVEGFAESPGMSGCGKLVFGPEATVAPTAAAAESASGLEIGIDVADEGIANPVGLAAADIAATAIALPAGMTANPSAAEGQGVCSAAQFAAASLAIAGCPEAAKLGSLEVDTPVLENHTLHGSFYLASQDDNPFGTLLGAYLTIRDPELGVFVKLAVAIDTDPTTGRIVTTVEDMPPFPLERVRVRLRQGPRAPLVTPPECGTYRSEVELVPSSGARPREPRPAFEISSGPAGARCPSGALPFSPGFEAGSANPAAAAFTPFLFRLTRSDGEQDITRFDATLPPGVVAKLAGTARCPDAAIAAAKGKSGREELAAPSCPATSKIGTILTGAGVGSALTYVPGSLYLAGPLGTVPLSAVAIVPAVAGPFDVGTVIVRQAVDLDPVTGRVRIDSAASDPIPHILAGIPLKVRDIRVLADRPDFTLNPTSCEPSNTFATIWGGGANPFSAADDVPVGAAARYQAASCASLGFSPRLGIVLKGGVRRGAHPALRAVVTPRPGDANFSRAVVTLPRSAFLDQAHIRTICTRVQFAAGAGHGANCPPGARYGFARAWSPLLDEPLAGPVFLRSSENNLPDLVLALKGPPSAAIEIELSARIDSVKGGIRSTFTGIPDAPVSRFILDMQGGRKGLIVNSRNLCREPKRNRARANLRGHNGRFSRTKPRVIATKCQKRRKAKRKSAKRSAGHVARASRAG
jgi:hypothetical protein